MDSLSLFSPSSSLTSSFSLGKNIPAPKLVAAGWSCVCWSEVGAGGGVSCEVFSVLIQESSRWQTKRGGLSVP